jgi:hypothetical protein
MQLFEATSAPNPARAGSLSPKELIAAIYADLPQQGDIGRIALFELVAKRLNLVLTQELRNKLHKAVTAEEMAKRLHTGEGKVWRGSQTV